MTTTAVSNSSPTVHGQLPKDNRAAKVPAAALRILVLDSQASQREAIAERLRADGFDATFADDAQEFLDVLQAKSPDAVIVDAQKDGLELLRKVRALEIQVPVLVLSDRADAGEATRLGAAATVTRPFEPGTLTTQLRQAIGDGRLPRELHLGDEGCPFELPPDGVDLEAVERGLLAQALVRTNGNQSRAARLLGISRYALRYRMQKFKLS
jgi:DNA-binding NtrC family response regulator